MTGPPPTLAAIAPRGIGEIAEGDDLAAVRTFLDGSANVTQDGSAPPPVSLPARFDAAGSTVIGSDVANWGAGWTVGVNSN